MFQLFKSLAEKINIKFTPNTSLASNYGLTDTQLASISLMLMVSHADFNSAEQEKLLAIEYVVREFKLTEFDAISVVEFADKAANDAISLHQFTTELKHINYEERLNLLAHLWQQAYADKILDPNEEAMLRKIADLLFIRHSDYIQIKLAVCKN